MIHERSYRFESCSGHRGLGIKHQLVSVLPRPNIKGYIYGPPTGRTSRDENRDRPVKTCPLVETVDKAVSKTVTRKSVEVRVFQWAPRAVS